MTPNPSPPHDDLPPYEAQRVLFKFIGAVIGDQLRVHYLLFLIVFAATSGAIFYLMKLDLLSGVILGVILWLMVNVRRYRLLLQSIERKHRKLYQERLRGLEEEVTPKAAIKLETTSGPAKKSPIVQTKSPSIREGGTKKPLQKPKPPASLS